MTREEAITVLKGLSDNPLFSNQHKAAFNIAMHDIKECVNMAIEALKHKPNTKNDLAVDCIDKTELLKAMDTWDKFGDDLNEGLIPLRTPALQDRYVPYVKYDDIVNCVKGMSSVTPQEPRKGHWIPTYGNVKCSECGSVKDSREVGKATHYCDFCGAKMESERE